MTSRFENVRSALHEDLPPWGVLVFESHHSREFTMAWRTHSFAKIVYVLDGAGSFDIDDTVFEFSGGDVIVVPPGVRNRIRDCEDHPVSLYAACIGETVLRCAPELQHQLVSTIWSKQPRRTFAVASVLRRMVWTQDRRGPSKSIEMLTDAWRLIGLLADDFQSAKTLKKNTEHSEAELVRQYVEELRTGFLDASTIDDAAETCGVSRRTFTRLFREETGTSWLAHVRQLAIDHASELLRESDLPIVSVAFEAGFADLSTFYRQFTKRVGCSPAAYRAVSGK